MKNTNATQDGKKVVVNFSMPRQSVVDMIKKQMADPEFKRKDLRIDTVWRLCAFAETCV